MLILLTSCVPALLQAALPEVQEQHQDVVKQIKALQRQEHALQEESLSIRLSIEQIDATIVEHNNKIKHWQKEVELTTKVERLGSGRFSGRLLSFFFLLFFNPPTYFRPASCPCIPSMTSQRGSSPSSRPLSWRRSRTPTSSETRWCCWRLGSLR